MLHQFDINKWLLQCLPPLLRKKVIAAFFSCCSQPLNSIYQRYSAYIAEVNRKVTPRSYNGILETFLNSIFYLPAGTIYLEDSINDTHYVFAKDEVPDICYLYTAAENNNIYLNFKPDEIFEGVYVNIPSALASDENINTIKQWIGYYKIAGVNYKIQIYE